ncbi:MAG: heme exporter protein CcmD [Candidatus Thioglobus sp.]|jgi:heme exporter protein D|uniref:heme exporter protein CcmD n=1 Tax=Candidatus Thioglobus sp. TaxID=2026721 RepID=UPI001D6ACCE7|nr:heme exporter protein CcmD [Candidatus Thioglobus sp.]MBT3187104.1 heme exporter protein CcmD [Candidatus Thioglobus sp.]MBT3431221.1 heme exporter protein CcmD [Candidatus Thioglobus sp.]MBT3964939.1 heme exporter protein CcmD [Candidatus Thioglobus sp.]MBT4316550.1 heme exporter protein CcmD [Candidatus Thioglobus sp.]MBT4553021.1 heme exporter protein CcmD [Candidatus Thioglobus sp.]
MTLAEYFSFLPFGKYAFYIWFSYLVTIITIVILFIRTSSIHKKTFLQLRIKYLREK